MRRMVCALIVAAQCSRSENAVRGRTPAPAACGDRRLEAMLFQPGVRFVGREPWLSVASSPDGEQFAVATAAAVEMRRSRDGSLIWRQSMRLRDPSIRFGSDPQHLVVLDASPETAPPEGAAQNRRQGYRFMVLASAAARLEFSQTIDFVVPWRRPRRDDSIALEDPPPYEERVTSVRYDPASSSWSVAGRFQEWMVGPGPSQRHHRWTVPVMSHQGAIAVDLTPGALALEQGADDGLPALDDVTIAALTRLGCREVYFNLGFALVPGEPGGCCGVRSRAP